MAPRTSFAARLAFAGALGGCSSAQPIDPAARLDRRPVGSWVLELPEPCRTLPGGPPAGRPNGIGAHTLPAGRYTPLLQDDHGIYFASPGGVLLDDPGQRGSRSLPGGIYRADATGRGWEYLGDASRISGRSPLPGRCRFVLAPAEAATPAAPPAAPPPPASPTPAP